MKSLRVESDTKPGINNSSDSFMGKGTIMTGTLKFPGNLTYHGHFKGKIVSDGKLIVGETGEIDSEISVAIALNSGKIRGSIMASERIQILPFGKIDGNVKTPDLQIESGAVFNGKSEMPAPPPRVLSTEGGDEKPGEKKKASKSETGGASHPQPLVRPQKTKKNRTVFSLFSIVAVIVMFYGAGLIKEHFFSSPVSEKTKSASSHGEKQTAKQMSNRLHTSDAREITGKTEKQAPTAANLPVPEKPVYKKAIPKKIKVTVSKKKSDKRRLATVKPLKKKRVQSYKEKLTGKNQKPKESKPAALEPGKNKPEDVDKLKSLASLQLSSGQSKKAIDTFKKILEISPSDSVTNLKLARLYFNSGYRELADIHFSRQEQLNPESLETVISEGFRQLNRKNSQKALSIFKKALIHDPENIRARYGLTAVYSKQNFYSKAIQICKSTLKSTPGIVPFQNELAWLNNRKNGSAGRISLSRR